MDLLYRNNYPHHKTDEPQNKTNSGTVNFRDVWQNPVKDSRLSTAIDNWCKQNIKYI
ncbi:MAG: hypothetical protein ACRC23_08730 [Aeromonas jandaei]